MIKTSDNCVFSKADLRAIKLKNSFDLLPIFTKQTKNVTTVDTDNFFHSFCEDEKQIKFIFEV